MGLVKNKTLPTSASGEYWRVVQVNMNYDRTDCVVTLVCYVDEDARNADAQPLTSVQLDLGDNFHDDEYSNGEDTMKNVSLKEVYKVLKSMSQTEDNKKEDKNADLAYFADATDV